MRKPILLGFFVSAFLMALWSTVSSGCANIVPPSGGPRDSIPPQLIASDPPDSTVNFTGNTITLDFDEYVDLRDVATNLMFTPTFNTNPVLRVRGRSIVIPFENRLEPNTTYILNFGNAIVDMNEGNTLNGFNFTFSTGPVLDSLEITGRAVLAETGGIDTTLIAVLHTNLEDSAVRLERAKYVTKLDRNGAFRFTNLPRDTFALYILGNTTIRRYQNNTELFAFADSPVIAGEADSLLFYAYRERSPESRTQTGTTQRIPATDRRLRFTQPTFSQLGLQDDYVLTFPVPLREFDSTRVQLSSDSTFVPASYSVTLDSTRTQLRFISEWKEDTRYNLVLEKEFAADTTGRQLLKTDTLFFTTKKLSDYGSITLRFRDLDLTRQPLLQFIQNNEVRLSVRLTSNVLSQNFIEPGDYNLRIVYDTNGNGRWDPGQFFGERRQPERVQPIERTISVKSAFVNEVEIDL